MSGSWLHGRSGRVVVAISAIVAASVAALLVSTSAHALTPGSTANFTLTGSVTGLAPGVPATLALNGANPNTVPITVTVVTITVTSPPVNCPLANLTINNAAFNASNQVQVSGLHVTIPASGSATINLPIEVLRSAPNGCQVTTFNFTYGGTALYIEPTATTLSATPNPTVVGNGVTMTATVAASGVPAGQSATPIGSVMFFRCLLPTNLSNGSASTSCTSSTAISPAETLNASGVAAYSTTSLPAGSDELFATYTPTDPNSFVASSSTIYVEQITGPPSQCTGTYSNNIIASPSSTTVTGTNGNDFIYAFGANYSINGLNGNDCIDAGDGNNTIVDGQGNDAVVAGNGNNKVTVGNGVDTVTVGTGSDTITVGNGNDSVTLGAGSASTVTLGTGADTVQVNGGSHDTIHGGNASETIYLGSGTNNTYVGGANHPNTCHLPSGTAASHHDTITNCTVVTP